jgi:2'-5' RNA ligase
MNEPSAGQASLAGFGSAAPTDRLFFALFPDSATAARLAALAQHQAARHGLHGLPLAQERLHLTLFHLGDWAGVPADVVDAATRAAAQLHPTAFEVRLDEAGSFVSRRDKKPLVLKARGGNQALRGFHAELGRQLGRHGLTRAASEPLEPHVTLLYDRSMVPFAPVEPVIWRAGEWVLVHSLLGQTRHRRLASWPLTGAPGG